MQLKRLVITNICIIVTALVVIGVLVFRTINTTLKSQFIHSNQLVLDNGVDLIEEFIRKNKDAVLNIAVDPNVQQQLDDFSLGLSPNGNIVDYVKGHWAHRNNINFGVGFLEVYPYVQSQVYSFDEESRTYQNQAAEDWMIEVIKKDGTFIVDVCEVNSVDYLRISMLSRSIQNWPNRLAILALYIKTETLLSEFYKIRLENSKQPYLVNQHGKIILPYENVYNISGEDLQTPGTGWHKSGKYIIINAQSTALDWTLMGILEENELLEKSRDIRNTFMIVGGTVVVFLVLVSILFSVWITRPISNLAKVMSKVEHNEFKEITIDPAYGHETKQLYRQFNYMIRRINSLIDEVYMAQIKEKEAELLALQQQINPHFLYNTLDSIAWMSLAYKAEDIRHMVMSLASMMRYSLNEGNNYISIRDELEQVRHYVGIQEIRYDNKFTTSIKCENDALDYQIIKLIIQPLVENAIVHGFKDTGNFGHISIIVEIVNAHLVIQVINDGIEIDLLKVRSVLNPDNHHKPKCYGLRNVNDRLIKSFGKGSSICFSVKDGKTIAKIEVATNLLRKDVANEAN